MISDLIKHNLVGNARSRRTVAVSRGVVAAALMGAVNFVFILIPIPDDMKVELNVALGPIVILASYLLFGQLDKAVKGEEDNAE